MNTQQEIPRIKVIVRKRPLNKKESSRNDLDIIDVKSKQTLHVKELKTKVDMSKYIEEHPFVFDSVYSEDSTNEELYLECVRPMIDYVFKSKGKVTCFAYGQTGSGKTFTMMGPTPGTNGQISTPGMYLLSGFDLFNQLNSDEYKHLQVFVSFYEIYCGKLFDLLNERNCLIAREDGKGNICITNLQEKQVCSLSDLMKVIDVGLRSRTVGVTGANSDSSRSHAIIQIMIKDGNTIHGKISFIDLAGSERAQDTVDTNKQTRVDGAEINKSLLALKECIRALDQNKNHTPFRGSKLTLVLRDSFVGGNCKTLMIANVSPSSVCAENTLNTLRYADRVKELKKEKENNQAPNEKEDLSRIMMMPRNHGNTNRYNVEKGYGANGVKSGHINLFTQTQPHQNQQNQIPKEDNKENKMNKQNIEMKIGSMLSMNLNQHQQRNSTLSYNTNSSTNQISSLPFNMNLNNEKEKPLNKQRNTLNPNNMDFINNFNYYNKQNQQQDEQMRLNQIKEKISSLSNKHENLLNQILLQEDNVVNRNREYVDKMVGSVKLHMQNIGEVEQSNSDILKFVKEAEKLLNNEMEQIKQLKVLFSNFNQMLSEEASLSNEISILQAQLPSNEIEEDDLFKQEVNEETYFDLES